MEGFQQEVRGMRQEASQEIQRLIQGVKNQTHDFNSFISHVVTNEMQMGFDGTPEAMKRTPSTQLLF
jgi:hypothetical protein